MPSNNDKRIRRTLAYIDSHLADGLTVESLSRVAALSKFHFHRQFAEWTGLSVHRYVQLARIRLASYRLAFRAEIPVADIAFDCGYGSPEAFSRMFKQQTGQTPSEFRAAPQWSRRNSASTVDRAGTRRMQPRFADDDVRLVNFAETPVAILDHHGHPENLAGSILRFISWRKRVGLALASSATFNLLCSDPDADQPETFRIALCVATRRIIAPNPEGVVASSIPAGRCAHMRLCGSDSQLKSAIAFLCGEWLPRSGAYQRDFPLFVRRLALFPDVAETEAVTDLYLPLRS